MLLVKPTAIIEAGTFGNEALSIIERAGRTCYKSEPKGESAAFVRRILDSQHESVIEHAGFSVRFVVDRGVSHELVRHRLAAFSQESTRYVNYSRKGGGHCQFIIPSWLSAELFEGENTEKDFYTPAQNGSYSLSAVQWLTAMQSAENAYRDLCALGWTAQQARSVLPNSAKTELVMTANYREWRHVFKLRTSKQAHPQMREVMAPLLDQIKTLVPVVFDDINLHKTV